MTAEPGNAELQRAIEALGGVQREGFANVNARLDKLVSQDVFLAEQRRVDERLGALQADFTEEKAERIAADKDEKAAREAQAAEERRERKDGDKDQQTLLDKMAANMKWLVAAVLLPTVFCIVTVYLSLRK